MTAKVISKQSNAQLPDLGSLIEPWLHWYGYWAKWLIGSDTAMRQFIRHPSDIPIVYCLGDAMLDSARREALAAKHLKDVSRGGLCFSADNPVRKGTPIHIEIPIENPPYEADGLVAWCRPEGDRYAVGVQFNEPSTRYSLRMVEQVCHIEHYRAKVLDTEGRELTSQEAAEEWIAKYAAEFPL